MATRRSRSPRFTRGKYDYIWTAVLVSTTVPSTVATSSIVQGTDWERTAAGLEHGTLVRIRGYVAVSAETAASAVASFAIYHADAGEGANDPSVVTMYTDERVLWSAGVSQTLNIEPTSPQMWPVDIKSKVKMKNSDEIRFVRNASAAGVIRFHTILRGLMQVGG